MNSSAIGRLIWGNPLCIKSDAVRFASVSYENRPKKRHDLTSQNFAVKMSDEIEIKLIIFIQCLNFRSPSLVLLWQKGRLIRSSRREWEKELFAAIELDFLLCSFLYLLLIIGFKVFFLTSLVSHFEFYVSGSPIFNARSAVVNEMSGQELWDTLYESGILD